MPFTEFCCRPGGSNLNAGTRTGNSTEPGTSADFTYASGDWVQGTGVFTVASGDPASDGVAVGDFASVYADGSSVTGFVGRVTARDSTTITVSLTAKAGTAPTDGTGNRTLKIGGAWLGPSGAEDFPFGWIQNTLTDSSGNTPRVNFKNDAEYDLTAGCSHGNAGPTLFQGYTTAYADGGRFVLDAQSNNIAQIVTLSGADLAIADAEIKNNNNASVASGAAIYLSGARCRASRLVIHDVRIFGMWATTGGIIEECECYAWTGRNGNDAAFYCLGPATFIRCVAHNPTGTTQSSGFACNTTLAVFINCIADGCNRGFISDSNGTVVLLGCDAYDCNGDGVEMWSSSATQLFAENCNLVKNGAYGLDLAGSTGARHGVIRNCGFGAGTQVNTSGATNGLKSTEVLASVTYANDTTPWVDPADGDFSLSDGSEAENAGRASFTQTAASYGPTTGYAAIGAAGAEAGGGGGGAFPVIGVNSPVIRGVL